jgi:hypothetical protein
MTDHENLIRYLKGVRRIVINAQHGGFGLSAEAERLYLKRSLIEYTEQDRASRDETERLGRLIIVDDEVWNSRPIKRDDPILVSVVTDLKKRSWGTWSKLKIVEIPADVKWAIADYDGMEWVAEVHRTWH